MFSFLLNILTCFLLDRLLRTRKVVSYHVTGVWIQGDQIKKYSFQIWHWLWDSASFSDICLPQYIMFWIWYFGTWHVKDPILWFLTYKNLSQLTVMFILITIIVTNLNWLLFIGPSCMMYCILTRIFIFCKFDEDYSSTWNT